MRDNGRQAHDYWLVGMCIRVDSVPCPDTSPRTHPFPDQPGDKPPLKIAARASTFSEFALLFTGAGEPGGATSDEDETGGVKYTQLAQRKKPLDTILPQLWRMRDPSTFFAPISLVVRFLAFAALAAGLQIRTFV